jgi:hypothetical protein
VAIKRKGIVATPGIYKYGELSEIKTAEELKDGAERYPIIPLTMGHPVDGIPTAKEQIGTVSQKWNADTNCVNGEFWFYDEKIPENLKYKLEHNEPIPISAGFLLDSVDSDGTQRGYVYTHMAVLDGEDPKCPLGTCGINIRMESNPTKLVRYEQAEELVVPQDKVEETKVEPTIPDEVKVEEPKVEEPVTEEPAEQKPEEQVKTEPVEEEVKLVPEVIIPTDTVAVHREYDVVDGAYVFVPQIFKNNKEK